MFKKLKFSLLLKFFEKTIAELLDRLKAKSPKIYAALVGVITIAKFGVTINETHYSLEAILAMVNITGSQAEQIADVITYVAVLLLGSKTTAYVGKQRRAKRIELAKARAAAVEAA